jgi:CheY-like chemotaxis protein
MKDGRVVLVVEDDEDDLFLLQRELARIGSSVIKHARDGRAAVDYLSGNGAFGDRQSHPLPDIIFLDLKLPRMNGHEVLEWIRKQPALGGIHVYVLTGSDEPKDRARVNEQGAAGYFVKPLLAAQLQELFA